MINTVIFLGLMTPSRGEQRSITAWNKCGKPWKLGGVRDGVCYVGVSFKNTETTHNACSAAQMFLNDGDGVVFLGDKGRWYSERKGEYHLDRPSARRLLSGVLSTYQSLHGKRLTEIFLHCRSTVNEEGVISPRKMT